MAVKESETKLIDASSITRSSGASVQDTRAFCSTHGPYSNASFGAFMGRDVSSISAHVDVQYPGVLHEEPGSSVTAEKRYAVLKANVDALKPLQLGLAVLRDDGRCTAWEFNLTGFHRESDPYSADSVEYLQARGMKLEALRVGGVPVNLLSMRLHHCGLLRRPGLAWVTYDGAYHVAHLLKVLNASQPLPGDITGLHALAGRFLQGDAYDVARMAGVHPNLPVGLERIADALGLPKPMVSPRLAGARVVLALQVFLCLGPTFYPGFAPVI